MSVREFADKWKLGPHHEIERFGALFLICVFGLVIVAVLAFNANIRSNMLELTDQAIYTERFATSLTGVDGNVVGVFGNSDRTRALLLVHIPDIDRLPTDASHYEMFLAAAQIVGNNRVMSTSPAGSIYMFGASGYVGFYFVNTAGFAYDQVLDLIVRNNRVLEDIGEPDMSDNSFAMFDQMRIFFNPGAAGVIEIEALESDGVPIPFDIFEQTVANPRELEIREEFAQVLRDMEITLLQIDEFSERAMRDEIVVGDPPIEIAGDRVVVREDGSRYLVTDTIIDGGLDFDWYNLDVSSGFLSQETTLSPTAINTPLGIYNYLQTIERPSGMDLRDRAWFTVDGTDITHITVGSQTGNLQFARLSQSIELLVNAWHDYYNLKTQYQHYLMIDLLNLEMQARDIGNVYTINSDESALTVFR